MLIPDLTLTPGLAERLRACGDERLDVRLYQDADTSWELAHDVPAPQRDDVAKERQWQIQQLCYAAGWPEKAPAAASVSLLHADGSELADHEQRRVEGVIAAHRAEAF